MVDPFEELRSLEDVEAFVARGYYMAVKAPLRSSDRPKLPLAVAEPGPLMEHAVALAGDDGLTMQELRRLFSRLGKERFDRGLELLRHGGAIAERRERRPNRGGRLQEQVVFTHRG